MMRTSVAAKTSTWRGRAGIAASCLVALGFTLVEIQRVNGQIAARYPDFFPWARRAAQFDLRHIFQWQWVDGLYPLGYPLLLRLGVSLGLDVLSMAFALSIIGGVLGLLGTFALVRKMTGSWALALFTEIVLGSTAHYLFFASLDSTDMLAAGLQICSLAVLITKRESKQSTFAAGAIAGLSYLIRYTTSLSILLSAIYLATSAAVSHLHPEPSQVKNRWWKESSIYLLGAALGAAPQLIASGVLKGNPLYTAQAHNLWYHLSGGDDYIFDWKAVPMDISLWAVVRAYPRKLVTHWFDQFRSFWTTRDALVIDNPFAPLMHAGLLFSLLADTKLKKTYRFFLGLYVIGQITLLSLIRLDKRFLIVLMPPLAFGAIYFLWNILPSHLKSRQLSIPLRIPVLILLTIWSMHYPLKFMRSNPKDRETIKVSNTLHAAGMQSAGQVYSTHMRYHDVAGPWKRRFAQASAIAPKLRSYDDLLKLLRRRGYQFLIYDDGTGTRLYPDLEFLLSPEARPEGLAPVYVHEEREHVIYRVLGDETPAYREADTTWANGIALKGYETYLSEDMPKRDHQQRLGVYLHWQATQPVTRMLKVFVHVMDANGQLVAQHDGIPALWTYSTDRWKVSEIVVDFHVVSFERALQPGSYAVQAGLYTEGSGRIPVLDAAGNPAGDSVTLQTINIP